MNTTSRTFWPEYRNCTTSILLTYGDYHMAMQLIVMAAFSVGWLSKLHPETVKMLARDRYADQSPWAHQTGNATA
ncbi:hypothetical protein [Leptospira santarosai]|uniref:hypothetical protein n=1 Tax=Leptospira santarosai TaxID=28183 RepID=UPI00034CF06B|nr:hypothetical protein [Leptospira santarosai]